MGYCGLGFEPDVKPTGVELSDLPGSSPPLGTSAIHTSETCLASDRPPPERDKRKPGSRRERFDSESLRLCASPQHPNSNTRDCMVGIAVMTIQAPPGDGAPSSETAQLPPDAQIRH